MVVKKAVLVVAWWASPLLGWTWQPVQQIQRSRTLTGRVRGVGGGEEDVPGETSLVRQDPAAERLLKQLRRADEAREDEASVREMAGCLTYEPSDGRRPWGVVHFVGGAGLGSYPGVAYGELLKRLCDEAGVGCIATPYDLGLDHSKIAGTCRGRFELALAKAVDELQWPAAAPVFGFGHSLGAKLLLLRQDDYDRLVLVAANNFGVADSARLFRAFLAAIAPDAVDQPWQSLVDVAVSAAQMAGVQVDPDPDVTLDILKADRQRSSDAFFVAFDDDALDSTSQLADALGNRADTITLQGGHLQCVYAPDFGVGSAAAVNDVVRTVKSALSRPARRALLTAGRPAGGSAADAEPSSS